MTEQGKFHPDDTSEHEMPVVTFGSSDIPEKFRDIKLSFSDDAPLLILVTVNEFGTVSAVVDDADLPSIIQKEIALNDGNGNVYPPSCPAAILMRKRLIARARKKGLVTT